ALAEAGHLLRRQHHHHRQHPAVRCPADATRRRCRCRFGHARRRRRRWLDVGHVDLSDGIQLRAVRVCRGHFGPHVRRAGRAHGDQSTSVLSLGGRLMPLARRLTVYTLLCVAGLVTLAPFYWEFVLATHRTAEISGTPPPMSIGAAVLQNYRTLLDYAP